MTTSYTTILTELAEIRDELIDMRTAIDNLASKQQLKQLLSLRQKDITNLQTRVSTLEQQVLLLRGHGNSTT